MRVCTPPWGSGDKLNLVVYGTRKGAGLEWTCLLALTVIPDTERRVLPLKPIQRDRELIILSARLSATRRRVSDSHERIRQRGLEMI